MDIRGEGEIPAEHPAEPVPLSEAPMGGLTPGILLAVRQQLEEAAAAMDATLRRAAVSTGIARSGGTAAGFYGPTGSVLIGGRESHPLLLEAAGEALGHLIRREAAEGRALAAGAIYWTNDPRAAVAGLEDLLLAVPIVREGSAVCFAVLSASHPALGRSSLGPAPSLRREGLVLPWTCVGRNGAVRPEILEVLAANAERPEELLEDLSAQLHALHQGRAVMEEMLVRFGPGVVAAIRSALEDGCRRGLQKLLDRLEVESIQGRVAPFAVRIWREADQARVAVEHIAEGRGPDLTPAAARAAVRAAFRRILAAESPAQSVLGGVAEALSIEIGWGDEAGEGAPERTRQGAAQAVAEAVRAAFADTLAQLSQAPDAGCCLLDLRGERADGSRYRIRLGLGGGLGASVFGDGLSHAAPSFSPLRVRPVEEIERAVPVRISRLELRPDSAGPGQYRGGLGALLELTLLEGRAEADVLLPGRAMGLRGGMRGAEARLALWSPEEGTREEVGPARISCGLRAGHRLTLASGGGGGWSMGFQRSLMRLEEDLARGLIGRDQAKNCYGLVLKPGSLEKDDHLTYRVRHYLLSTLAAEDIIAGEELLE